MTSVGSSPTAPKKPPRKCGVFCGRRKPIIWLPFGTRREVLRRQTSGRPGVQPLPIFIDKILSKNQALKKPEKCASKSRMGHWWDSSYYEFSKIKALNESHFYSKGAHTHLIRLDKWLLCRYINKLIIRKNVGNK